MEKSSPKHTWDPQKNKVWQETPQKKDEIKMDYFGHRTYLNFYQKVMFL